MLAVVYYITIALILNNELVMADDHQCTDFQFKSPFLPGESCEAIYNKNPDSQTKPGYYWILSREYCGMTYTGSSCEDIYYNNPETGDKSGYYHINEKWTYCNMKKMTSRTVSPTTTTTATSLPIVSPTPATGDFIPTCAGVGGGWKRIANFDISAGDDCPSGWRKDSYNGTSFCRIVSDGLYSCSSAIFSTNGTSYRRVCGKARGYQKGWTASFYGYRIKDYNIEKGYADGLLITYGNPRNHIWSYVNGLYDSKPHQYNCPCASGNGFDPPPFISTNYYCEAGTNDTIDYSAYYFDDPLWDGSGCIISRCCDNSTHPWFYQELSTVTTSEIEARICKLDSFSTGSTLIDQLELYIQ